MGTQVLFVLIYAPIPHMFSIYYWNPSPTRIGILAQHYLVLYGKLLFLR